MNSVLIVDDDAAVGDAISRTLRRAGYEVRVITRPEGALDAYREARADLVITDIIMPNVNGVDLTAALRREDPAARVLAISGGGNFASAQFQPEAITTTAYLAAASKAGADAVLTKPFESTELLAAVRRLLEA